MKYGTLSMQIGTLLLWLVTPSLLLNVRVKDWLNIRLFGIMILLLDPWPTALYFDILAMVIRLFILSFWVCYLLCYSLYLGGGGSILLAGEQGSGDILYLSSAVLAMLWFGHWLRGKCRSSVNTSELLPINTCTGIRWLGGYLCDGCVGVSDVRLFLLLANVVSDLLTSRGAVGLEFWAGVRISRIIDVVTVVQAFYRMLMGSRMKCLCCIGSLIVIQSVAVVIIATVIVANRVNMDVLCFRS